MRSYDFKATLCGAAMLAAWCAAALEGQSTKEPYTQMAPVAEYQMAPAPEIALARSAAPKAISADADVLVLDRDGFRPAVKGSNGWTCLVERSWNAAVDFPEFWNPKIRAPICLNPAAVRSVLPVVNFWTARVLARQSKAQMTAAAKAAFESKKLPPLEPGAMSYMMSKDGYLTDDSPHFHPHVMFFAPLGEGTRWGANLPGSPVFSGDDTVNRMAILPIQVPRWSDGTPDDASAK